MSIRNKTKRRLLVLVIGTVVVVSILVTVVTVRLRIKREAAAEQLVLAIAASKDGRFPQAIDHFRKSRFDKDPEALYWLAHARREVPLPNNRHLEESVNYLDHAVRLRPGDRRAEHELLELYVYFRRDTEALRLADRVLAQDAADVPARRTRITALTGLGRLDEALDDAQKAIAAYPDEYRYHLQAIDLMDARKLPVEQIMSLARAALDRHPDDPRFKLVMGLALGVAGERQKALDTVQPLVEIPSPDEDFLVTLVSILDQLSRYDLSLTAMRAGSKTIATPRYTRALLRRLWEAGDQEGLQAELADLDPASPKTRTESIALKALALIPAGKTAEARALIAALKGRASEPQAEAWAIVLDQSIPDASQTAAQVLAALNRAIALDASNPYLYYARGDTLSRLGEVEAAIVQWNRATRDAASWYLPYLRMAQGFSAAGRHEEAQVAAFEARRRAPRNVLTIITQMEVAYAALAAGFGSASARAQLLDQLAEVQRQAPHEPRTLAMYADLLGETGDRTKAAQVLGAALEDPKAALTEELLMKLAAVSRKHAPTLEEGVYARWEALHGLTPALARARAQALLVSQGAPAAGQYFTGVLDRIGEPKSQRNWRVAHAQVLDLTGDPRARELWASLAKDFPEDLAVQRGALESRALRGDRAVLDFAVGRIKAITGDSGMSWRVAQARLMVGEGASQADLSAAAVLLKQIIREAPSLVEPRGLLAEVHRRLGANAEAIEQLSQFATLQPGNSSVLIDLAQLRIELGDFTGARKDLERINPARLSTSQTVQVAAAWASLGENATAVKLLDPLYKATPTDTRIGLLLAQSQARQGQIAQSLAVLDRLAAEPNAAVILARAELLASTGKYDEALAALSGLNDPKIGDFEREISLATFHRRHIDRVGADPVIAHLRAAIAAQPGNPLSHRALASLYVQQGKVDEALAVNAQARKGAPGDVGFTILERESALISAAAELPMLREAIVQVIESGPYRDRTVEAIRLVIGSNQKKAGIPAASRALRQIADQSPRSIVLQNLTIDWYLATGQADSAVELASRATRAFPREGSTAERSVRALAQVKRWEEVVTAAEEWRRRAPSRAQAADLEIARALVNLGQAPRALERLEPYRSAAVADPRSHSTTLGIYAGALVGAGRYDDAEQLFKPLLAASPQWRQFWMNLASDAVRDVKVAVHWLEQVTPMVPPDSLEERSALAQAWSSLASRENDVAFGDRAIETLAALAAKPDADPRVTYTHAVTLYNQAGRLSADAGQAAKAKTLYGQAEAAYRRCIARAPENWSAMNNLAVLIVEQGGSIDEAAKLAEKAIGLRPDSAALLDTLADIDLRRKQYDRAVSSLDRAVELDPTNPEWRVNLAYALQLKGDRRRMGEVLRDINPSSERVRRLSPAIRQRLDQLIGTLKTQPSAG